MPKGNFCLSIRVLIQQLRNRIGKLSTTINGSIGRQDEYRLKEYLPTIYTDLSIKEFLRRPFDQDIAYSKHDGRNFHDDPPVLLNAVRLWLAE
jgi:hypothetical protein